jgi:hypothetical protein
MHHSWRNKETIAIMDVPHMPRKEEYAQDIAQKAPSYQQTTQHCNKQMTLFLLLFHKAQDLMMLTRHKLRLRSVQKEAW